jgi:hypothetical protein
MRSNWRGHDRRAITPWSAYLSITATAVRAFIDKSSGGCILPRRKGCLAGEEECVFVEKIHWIKPIIKSRHCPCARQQRAQFPFSNGQPHLL